MSLHHRKNHPCSLLSSIIILASIGLAVATICCSALGAQNDTAVLRIDSFAELDPCVLQSVYSFVYPASYPPSTLDELKNSCRRQQDGFKCLKDKSKKQPALLKRGLNTILQNRQRYHKKYCTNVQSEASKQHVSDMKCIMDRKLSIYKEVDNDFIKTLYEVRRRNYNDSALELKYLCCAFVGYRKKIIDSAGPECAASQQGVEEMITSIVSNDINLICDDEDKLTLKVCPTLEPYKLPKTLDAESRRVGPSGLAMYLLMTLGEPDKTLT